MNFSLIVLALYNTRERTEKTNHRYHKAKTPEKSVENRLSGVYST